MNKLRDMCTKLPIDLHKIRDELFSSNYSPNDLSIVLSEFVDENCFYDTDDFINKYARYPLKSETHSGSLYELTSLFIEYGLDLNYTVNDDSYIYNIEYADYEYTAADTYRLLLENGLNPNVSYGSCTFFDELDSKIVIDVGLGLIEDDDSDNTHSGNWRLYDAKFHCWLVFISFGASLSSEIPPLNLKDGYSYINFRQHENFDFRIEYTSSIPGGYILHIFNKHTLEEVAFL